MLRAATFACKLLNQTCALADGVLTTVVCCAPPRPPCPVHATRRVTPMTMTAGPTNMVAGPAITANRHDHGPVFTADRHDHGPVRRDHEPVIMKAFRERRHGVTATRSMRKMAVVASYGRANALLAAVTPPRCCVARLAVANGCVRSAHLTKPSALGVPRTTREPSQAAGALLPHHRATCTIRTATHTVMITQTHRLSRSLWGRDHAHGHAPARWRCRALHRFGSTKCLSVKDFASTASTCASVCGSITFSVVRSRRKQSVIHT